MTNFQKEIERRTFLKGVGAVMAAVAATTVVKPVNAVAAATDGFGTNVIERKIQRYPWWVKEVDTITTQMKWDEVNPIALGETFGGRAKPPLPPLIDQYEGVGTTLDLVKGALANLPELAHSGTPGESMPAMALNSAARSVYWWNTKDAEFPGDSIYYRMREMGNMYYDIQKDPRMGKWEATPEEATAKFRQAANFFGLAQVGICPVDAESNLMRYSDFPPLPADVDWKHVLTFVIPDSWETQKRVGTALGDAGNRWTKAQGTQATWALITFIEQLGYKITRWNGNPEYSAIRSGIGELGRHNRVVSPIYGGSFHMYAYVTDLPLVNDNPIDFGLQEFCKNCKKCAEVCPSKAIVTDKEPTWDFPADRKWHQHGKLAYYENSIECSRYLNEKQQMCGLCLVACPWSKQDKTALHDIVKIFSAKTPGLSGVIKAADDAFGYGNYYADGELGKIDEFWDLDLPRLAAEQTLKVNK